jgi:hypothetical protein
LSTDVMEKARDAARAILAAKDEVARIERALAEAKEELQFAINDLENMVGVGGVVAVPERDALVIVKPGRRAVDRKALASMAESLPRRLRPLPVVTVEATADTLDLLAKRDIEILSEEERLPKVEDIRRMAPVLSANGIDPEKLVRRGDPTVTIKVNVSAKAEQ